MRREHVLWRRPSVQLYREQVYVSLPVRMSQFAIVRGDRGWRRAGECVPLRRTK